MRRINMKKIGLLTFHASHNCGSMLQAYALQTKLIDLGYDVEIINFSNKGQRDLYNIFYKNNNIKNILKNILIFPHLKRIKQNINNYNKFIKDNLKLSKMLYKNNRELIEENLDYDIYVCGSDQIWNITICDGDEAYFLPFVKKHPKIAYAPSFGAKNIQKYTTDVQKYSNYIKDFSSLSIRENNGKKWIKNLTNIDVPVLLDPTLLIEKKEYEKIEQPIKLPSKYIFYYAPGYMESINKFVSKVSKKYNMPVIVFNSKQYYIKGLKYKGFILPEIENPSSYLWLIKNAQLVFTTSFHGTIFSSIYRKNFWTLKNGGMFGDDDRVKTLVEKLHIEDRLILPNFDKNFNYLEKPNYSLYENSFKHLVKSSNEYLEKALSDKNEERK